MRSFLLSLYLLSTALYGLSLEEVIQEALDKKPSLRAIEHRIAANRSNVDVSNQFSNPVISIADNTLPSDQAMSRSTISLQQKLPFLGKRDSLEKISLAEDEVLNTSLEKARVELVKAIKNQAYTIWELEALYKTIEEYEHITKQNIELFESYTATSDNQHMGIMSAELTLSDLRIQRASLEAKIFTAYAQLSYLANFHIESLNIKLVVWDLPSQKSLKESLSNNKDLAIKEKELQKAQAKIENAELNNYPDFNLLASYAYRQEFDNFWTFGVGMSLPIYGTEDYKEQEAREARLSVASLKEDVNVKVNADFEAAYVQMRSAYTIYHIVEDDALPKVEHMFELTSSSIATGGDLFKYIDILVQKLKLEQKSIAAVAIYNRSMATIEALSGETE